MSSFLDQLRQACKQAEKESARCHREYARSMRRTKNARSALEDGRKEVLRLHHLLFEADSTDDNVRYENLVWSEKEKLESAEEELRQREQREEEWYQKASDAAKRYRDVERAWKHERERLFSAEMKARGLKEEKTPKAAARDGWSAAIRTWREAVDAAFEDLDNISAFPEPPAVGLRGNAACKQDGRALKACAYQIARAFREAGVDLKTERRRLHPDRFSRRPEMVRMAAEVFKVVNHLYELGG